MGKSLSAAVLAALLVSIFVNLVMMGFGDDGRTDFLRRAEEAEKAVGEERDRLEILTRRLDAMERRVSTERRSARRAEAEAALAGDAGTVATDDAGRPLAPDGTPYISKTELDKAVEQAIAARFPGTDPNWKPEPPKPAQTLEEVALEMGLTAGEEAQLRIIMREGEEEMLSSLFGDRTIPEIKAELAAAKEDPDKLSQLAQQVAMRGVSNFGRLATLEKRNRMRVEQLLGEERAQEFHSHRVKPIHGDDVENLLDGVFD